MNLHIRIFCFVSLISILAQNIFILISDEITKEKVELKLKLDPNQEDEKDNMKEQKVDQIHLPLFYYLNYKELKAFNYFSFSINISSGNRPSHYSPPEF